MSITLSTFMVSLLCSSLVSANAIPEITPAPVLPRQAYSSRFIGYDNEDGTYVSNACPTGYTWTESSIYGRCCAVGVNCDFITACDSSWVFADDGSSDTCTDIGYTCNTDFIYQSLGDATPVLWMGCATGEQHAYYVTPPTAAASVSSFPTSTAPSTTTASSVASSSSSSSSTSTTPTPTPQPPKPKKSKGWIAGVVAGPVAAIAIAGLLFWIFKLKRRNKAQGPQHTGSTAPVQGGAVQGGAAQQQYPPPMMQHQSYQQYPSPVSSQPMSPNPMSPAPAYTEPNQGWTQTHNPHDSMYKQPYTYTQPAVETPPAREGAYEIGGGDVQPIASPTPQHVQPTKNDAVELGGR